MRAISYVRALEGKNAGALFNARSRYADGLSDLCVFDKEVRRLAAVVPDAHCCAGVSDYNSWFMADLNVIGGRYLVLSYGKWEDGQFYWNLQNNTDVDGPDGIVDLKRSKLFGVVLRYLSGLVNAA